MHAIRQNWYTVDRYLYDTYYDYPRVYQRYLRVRDDIRVLPPFLNEERDAETEE